MPLSDFNLTGHYTGQQGRSLPGANQLATIINMLRNIRAVDPRFLDVTYHGTGINLHAKIATPFLGQVNPSNAAQIIVGRDRAESGYPYDDTITIGLDTLQKTTAETVTVSATGYVYYTITKSGTTITATLTAGTSRPTQTDSTLYWIIGKVFWDATDSRVKYYAQQHYGEIHVPATLIDAEDCS